MADSKISGLSATTAPATTDEAVLASSGSTKKITLANLQKVMPGYQYDRVAITSSGTSTATVEASATTIITGSSITLGAEAVRIIVTGASLTNSSGSNVFSILNIWRDSTNLGRCGISASIVGTAMNSGAAFYAEIQDTPGAGTYVYTARLWGSGASTQTLIAGAGGAGNYAPAVLRVVRV